MRIRIKSFNGELPSYLTVGKAYEVDCFYEDRQNYPCVYADNKHHIVVVVDKCGHLNGGSWEVVSDNITDSVADIKYHVSPNTVVIE